MGFFDPPDKKLRDKLSPDTAERAQQVVALVESYAGGLSYHHRREVEFYLFMAWLQDQLSRFGVDQLHGASLGQYATCFDQAQRIGGHFTREQAGVYDMCVRHLREHVNNFDPSSMSDV
ncbi:hypothetical protein ACETK8_09695 [Brevundimonas staleyi]|uniref:Uncharacterized protein n=1 Tax=Brevundimonas staleyi TaxID=74326 RepID=A0ABW0FS46_9CAUL